MYNNVNLRCWLKIQVGHPAEDWDYVTLTQGRDQRITYLVMTQKLNPEARRVDKSTIGESRNHREGSEQGLRASPAWSGSVQETPTMSFYINAISTAVKQSKSFFFFFLEKEWAIIKFIK